MLGEEPRIDLEIEHFAKSSASFEELESTAKELPPPLPSQITSRSKSKKLVILGAALMLQKFKKVQQRILSLHSKKSLPHDETALATEHLLRAQTFEQLQKLIDKKRLNEKDEKELLRFVDDLIYEGDKQSLIDKHGDGGKISTLLAQILFLVDNDLIPVKWKTQAIERSFQEALQKQQNEMLLKEKTALPVVIAKFLVLSDGSLNCGIIPELNKKFIEIKKENLNYIQSLKSGMQLIHQSSKFRELLQSVRFPISLQGERLVRETLHLTENTQISFQDTLICLVAGFLTHLRQGQSGSCFASFIAIEQQRLRPEETLRDLIQLLEKGGLTRTVNGEEQFFPYLSGSCQEGEAPSHPLLRAWENSIAAMAEAESGGLLSSALFRSIAYLFKKQRNMMPCLGTQKAVEGKLQEILKSDTRYLYDSCSRNSPEDPLSGAFILHRIEDGKFIPVQDSHEFFNLVISIVEKIAPQCTNLLRGNESMLLLKLLKKYHPTNWGVTKSRHSIEILNYTPWKTCTGNNPKIAMKVYYSMNEDPKILVWKPFDAKELAEKILNLSENAQEELMPVKVIGQHAFSLFPKHLSIHLLNQFDELQTQAEKFKKLPLTKSMQKRIIEQLSTTLLNKKQSASLLEKSLKMPSKTNLHHYRDFLLTHLSDFLHSEDEIPSLQRKIDLAIYSSLPLSIRKQIEASIAVIGDSNWQIGTQDIHYGIGINPASGKIELLSVLEDGTLYKYLTQSSYLLNHTWEVYFA